MRVDEMDLRCCITVLLNIDVLVYSFKDVRWMPCGEPHPTLPSRFLFRSAVTVNCLPFSWRARAD